MTGPSTAPSRPSTYCKVKDEPKLECRQDVCSCKAQSAKSPATRDEAPDLKLLPCPFCGEQLVRHSGHHGSWFAHRDETGGCTDSVVQIHDDLDAEKWNKRTPASERTRSGALKLPLGVRYEGDVIPVADIQEELAHIEQNGIDLAKFGGENVDEGRCRVLCASYLRTILESHFQQQRLDALLVPSTVEAANKAHDAEPACSEVDRHIAPSSSTAASSAEQAIREHNEGCDEACAARRPNERQSGGCGYQKHDGSLVYSRRCPECPQDWKIDFPLVSSGEEAARATLDAVKVAVTEVAKSRAN